MNDSNALPILYTRLAVCACDPVRMEELASWYESHARPDDAACVRWVMQRKLRPFCYSRRAPLAEHSSVWRQGWYWWATNQPGTPTDWGHPADCRLPHDLWQRLRHSWPYQPLVFKEYATLQLAFEALIEQWKEWSAPRERAADEAPLAAATR